MSDRASRREVFSNPFFVVLLGTSLVFVLTIMGYLVSPYILVPDPARPRPGANSVRLADWFDRRGPIALAVEFGIMLVSGVLAMVTDPWFSPKAKSKSRSKQDADRG
jgi:hypothetical protein